MTSGAGTMRLGDSFVLTTSPEAVWSFLIDVAEVAVCVPGMVAASVEIVEPGRVFVGTAELPLGSSALRFPARLEWLEQDPPSGGRLRAEAIVAGYAVAGDGHIVLEETAEGKTQFSWSAEMVVPEDVRDNPMMMQMTSLFASRFVKAFFNCLRARLQTDS